MRHIDQEISPNPFAKEGYIASLWQREVRRDFIDNVPILMVSLVNSDERRVNS